MSATGVGNRAATSTFVVDRNPKRTQELQVLRGDVQLTRRREFLLPRSFFGASALVESDGRLQHEKDIVASRLDARHYVGDLLRLRYRLVDGLSQFLHQLFQFD